MIAKLVIMILCRRDSIEKLELIIDKYIDCEPLGKSGKDPIMMFKKNSSAVYMGGAGAIANNVSLYCKKVKFISSLGKKNNYEKFVNKNLEGQGGATITKIFKHNLLYLVSTNSKYCENHLPECNGCATKICQQCALDLSQCEFCDNFFCNPCGKRKKIHGELFLPTHLPFAYDNTPRLEYQYNGTEFNYWNFILIKYFYIFVFIFKIFN